MLLTPCIYLVMLVKICTEIIVCRDICICTFKFSFVLDTIQLGDSSNKMKISHYWKLGNKMVIYKPLIHQIKRLVTIVITCECLEGPDRLVDTKKIDTCKPCHLPQTRCSLIQVKFRNKHCDVIFRTEIVGNLADSISKMNLSLLLR